MNCMKKLAALSVPAMFALSLVLAGCEKKATEKPSDKGGATPQAQQKEKPKEPLIKKQEIADWCPEHGVPESICTRCNPALVEGFKKKGDWCKEHDLPESQCLQCHPEFKEKFELMKLKSQG